MSAAEPSQANSLQKAYAGLQEQLRAGLQASRSVLDHAPSKGAGSENNWLTMLQRHLPNRYSAETAFVIDSRGAQSEQIDIVLYDRQYTPELYNVAGQRIIPAESVYAALEVKQTLDRSNIDYAAGKIASVRALHRTSAAIVHAGGEHEARALTPILGGVLATEPGWKTPFGDPFFAALLEQPPERRLDLGCVASAGAFEVRYDSATPGVRFGMPEYPLAFLFLCLLHRLQRVGTVPAIDYDAYLAPFEHRT